MSEKPITQRIKDRLAAYTAMLRDIDNQLERLDRMEMTMASPPGPDLTGMPRGSGTPSDRTGMMVERKMELEEQIDRLKAEEKQERNAIEGLILQLSDPDERAVIRLRYFDRADWESTCGVLFGDRRDYVDRADAYTPPFVAPRRVLTLDELRKRGFGEALYSQLTPEQRQQTLILRDADELGELITNREEAMAAETMLTNGCVMKHIADDVDKADEMEIRFYSEASNPATYTPTAKWDATGGKILKDLEAMIRMLTKRGLRASDLVCSPDVADTIINDAAVQKLLDNRRIEIGKVEPELLPDGAAIVAHLNVLGRIISVISYDLTYTDDEGNDKLYIPSGKCVLTAPGAGRTAYGAVSQVEQSDGEFHTYAGRRVPKYVSSAEGNSRTLTISSRPLMIPNNKNPFIVADVLTD